MVERQAELMTKLVELLEKQRRDSDPMPWEAWMYDFLRDLERHQGVVSRAIDLNVKSRDTIYKARRRNHEFARRWENVLEEAREKARARRRRRARERES